MEFHNLFHFKYDWILQKIFCNINSHSVTEKKFAAYTFLSLAISSLDILWDKGHGEIIDVIFTTHWSYLLIYVYTSSLITPLNKGKWPIRSGVSSSPLIGECFAYCNLTIFHFAFFSIFCSASVNPSVYYWYFGAIWNLLLNVFWEIINCRHHIYISL